MFKPRLTILSVVLFVPVLATSLWARDPDVANTSSTSNANEVKATTLRKEEFAVRPQIGFMNYQDNSGSSTTSTTFGLMADINAINVLDLAGMAGGNWYLGASTGLTYSRVGTFGSTFLSLPANIKFGLLLTEFVRIGIHGGGDATYRSTALAMQLESPGAVSSNARLDLFPNAGGDIDVAITNHLVASFRPDVIFNSGKSVFSGAFSLTIPLTAG